ncbi:MAG: dihydroorotate dehydrogenase (quinone) [Bacteroidia bacterium]|nr:MAG: dihydroorotate dehydrogenase (quinone) [Bacteroidia bacterium]
MYCIIRKILFLLDAETAHHIGLSSLSFIHKILPKRVFKWLFKIPDYSANRIDKNNLFHSLKIGLAAGLDKNAQHYKALAALGFQFVEIGTVTPRPQSGNPKPRLFRLIKDEAIINRMGFNNDGVQKIKERLTNKPTDIVVGVNIGKNKDTPNDKAIEDYLICFRELYSVADYFVVNVSSPNTPNLRELQEKEPLMQILKALREEEKKLSKDSAHKVILLKIAPDLSDDQLKDIVEVVVKSDIDGIIATNTTITRDNLRYEEDVDKYGQGGLSGKPLFEKSLYVVKKIKELLPDNKILIGVGGIDNTERAQMMLNAGANAIQLYTGFIYKGPQLITEIRKSINV